MKAGPIGVRSLMAPRLMPVVLLALVVLAGVKAAGLARLAMAETAPPARQASQATQPQPPAARAPGPSQQPPQPQVFTPPRPAPDGAPEVSEAERAILLDLRRRRTELDGKAAQLAEREGLLAAAERRLADRVAELASLQARLEALEMARSERDEDAWRGLVKLYEAMKPRDAATIFNDLDRPVLLGVLDRMKAAKAAQVLAAMQPERARQATAELARRRAEANRPAAAPPQAAPPSSPQPTRPPAG
jgi:flagellar motility protein MotE (MotC chaperone)